MYVSPFYCRSNAFPSIYLINVSGRKDVFRKMAYIRTKLGNPLDSLLEGRLHWRHFYSPGFFDRSLKTTILESSKQCNTRGMSRDCFTRKRREYSGMPINMWKSEATTSWNVFRSKKLATPMKRLHVNTSEMRISILQWSGRGGGTIHEPQAVEDIFYCGTTLFCGQGSAQDGVYYYEKTTQGRSGNREAGPTKASSEPKVLRNHRMFGKDIKQQPACRHRQQGTWSLRRGCLSHGGKPCKPQGRKNTQNTFSNQCHSVNLIPSARKEFAWRLNTYTSVIEVQLWY